MKRALEEFIAYLYKEEGKSKNTCQSYERDLRQFFEFAEQRDTGLSEITGDFIEFYENELKENGKSVATISRLVASLKAFFGYALKNGWVSQDPTAMLHGPKVMKKKPGILSIAQVQKLLAQPDPGTEKGVRDRAMLELMAATGMRVSELIDLKFSDVDTEERRLVVRRERPREIRFDQKTAGYLQNYLGFARQKLLDKAEKDEGYLFLNISGEQMSRQGFWKLLKRYGKAAGIEQDLTPHTLRHSFAVNALDSGRAVREVQEILGHSDVSTTMEYTKLKSLC